MKIQSPDALLQKVHCCGHHIITSGVCVGGRGGGWGRGMRDGEGGGGGGWRVQIRLEQYRTNRFIS